MPLGIESYHESLRHLHVGCLAPHAYFIPFGSRRKDGRNSQRSIASTSKTRKTVMIGYLICGFIFCSFQCFFCL